MIVGFLMVSIAVSSCLGSDEETPVYSTDATIHAFSLDTIHGVDYRFEIDQLNNLIYNPDSLPVDADTLIDSIQVDVLSVMLGVMSADTTFSTDVYHNLLPAMNATGSNGVKLVAYAPDGVTNRTYTLQIRVHKQDPDSLTWVQMDNYSENINPGEQKAVVWNDNLLLYVSPTRLYRTSAAPEQYAWSSADVAGLPAQADVTSLVNFEGKLYMLAAGDVYVSADALTWQKSESLSGNVCSLVACLPSDGVAGQSASLVGIRVNEANDTVSCVTTDGQTWEDGEKVEATGFPRDHIYYANYTTGSGVSQTMVMGMPRVDEDKTVPWTSNTGLLWTSLATEVEGVSCPGMDKPVLLHYNGKFYVLGGAMNAIYESVAGIAWQRMEKKFLLPAAFAGKTSYTVVIDPTPAGVVSAADKRDFIWVIFGGNGQSNEVWRGRLNKLGFERE